MLINLNSFVIRTFLWLSIFVLTVSWKSDDAESKTNDVFDHIRPAFELMEFIANAEFVSDYSSIHEKLIRDLKSDGIVFHPSDKTNSTARQDSSFASNQTPALHFTSEDKKYQLEILQHHDKTYLFNYWKQSLTALGLKSDIRNDLGGSVYLTVEAKDHGALGAVFYTGRNVMSIQVPLSFPIPETYDELSEAEQTTINERFQDLSRILEVIAKHYVAPSEFVFYPTQGAKLTSDQRLYGFIQFWTEVKYNFAFFDQVPELNWDHVLVEYLPLIEKDQSNEEYYLQLEKICALLKDGHTNIYPPYSVVSNYSTPALQLMNIQRKAVVENVAVSLKEDIPIGAEVVSVDGLPADEYLKTKVFPSISSSTEHILWDWGIREMLKGKSGTSVEVVINTPDKQQKKLLLPRAKKGDQIAWTRERKPWKLFEFERLEDDIAYVALNSFGTDEIVEEFENHLDTINSCKGLILDLRGNGGGNSANAYEIIKHLTSKPFLTSKWRTREHRAAFKAWGKLEAADYRSITQDETLSDWQEAAIAYYNGEKWYGEAPDTIVPLQNKKINLPTVVLMGHNTASAAEDFLIALDNLKIATTVGEKTFGSTGQPLPLDLPGGGSARICAKRDEYPDGRQFVGFGIEPEIYVESTLDDFLSENDAILAKGVETMKLRAPSRAK